jgi:hypothetical protein
MHSGALKRGGMDENILAAIVGLNEAEAFLAVVEFHRAGIHKGILSLIEVHLIPGVRARDLGREVRCLEDLNVRLAISVGETA